MAVKKGIPDDSPALIGFATHKLHRTHGKDKAKLSVRQVQTWGRPELANNTPRSTKADTEELPETNSFSLKNHP